MNWNWFLNGICQTFARENQQTEFCKKKLDQSPINFRLGSVESEFEKVEIVQKSRFWEFLLAACCKSEVLNFLFLLSEKFSNQISPKRWLTNSLLDKQRTLRILNMVCCHIWIRKRWYPPAFSSKSWTYLYLKQARKLQDAQAEKLTSLQADKFTS